MSTEKRFRKKRKGRGFAGITVRERRQISRQGGKALAPEQRFFAQNPDAARIAGAKGGQRRREANAKDVVLLKKALDGPVEIPFGSSGRTLVKVARLARLGYWEPVSDGSSLYAITEEGRAFLARVASQEIS